MSDIDMAFSIARAEQMPCKREPLRNGEAAKETMALYLPIVEMEAGRRVLDVGSGDAFLRPIYQERGWTYTGLDLFGTNDVLKGDIHTIDDIGQFDLVWSSHSLEHSPFPMLMILRMFNATRKGGYGIFTMPQLPMAVPDKGHWSVLDERGWTKLFVAVGYTVVRMDSGYYTGDWNEWRFLVRKA